MLIGDNFEKFGIIGIIRIIMFIIDIRTPLPLQESNNVMIFVNSDFFLSQTCPGSKIMELSGQQIIGTSLIFLPKLWIIRIIIDNWDN